MNPIMIYLIHTVDNIRILFSNVIIISIFIIFFMGLNYKNTKKMIYKLLLIIIISSVLLAIIPSKETLIAMMVAKAITIENLQADEKTVRNSIDYILKKIEDMKEE